MKIKIVNKSKNIPFEINSGTDNIREDIRLKYRYLDLRTERMKNNLIMRSKVIKFIRDFYTEKGFIEIETPILTICHISLYPYNKSIVEFPLVGCPRCLISPTPGQSSIPQNIPALLSNDIF